MRKLIEFIRSIYVVALFVVLELAAVNYYAGATAYTEARLLAQSARLTGGMHSAITDAGNFLRLGRENRALTERLARLEEEVATLRSQLAESSLGVSEAMFEGVKYRMVEAAVVSITTHRANNYIIVNRGSNDGVRAGMGITTGDGAIVGYVVECSPRHAVGVTLLSEVFRGSGAPVGGSNYQGSITWDGKNPHFVNLEKLSKYAEPQIGQEVLTTGLESYFPAGLKIGTIESLTPDALGISYTARLRLSAELSKCDNLILMDNLSSDELRQLEGQAAQKTN
ncbi:MAG: rod shape-determining protein MreC [Alistipes sp.]|nr:rod shape-determining protein MreC [Alistipes sp.]MBQ1938651.1 rod shape-determining protein MreC [Alistipes sp.]MBQ2393886.1 rod shape-determining protein MreC [Alistipes sp.]MBQ5638143.1 rod shape-determining protein MreC [Alistipes sp.]MBQ5718021.1 rod shape-determining protein MreC [Alistipes sp.]